MKRREFCKKTITLGGSLLLSGMVSHLYARNTTNRISLNVGYLPITDHLIFPVSHALDKQKYKNVLVRPYICKSWDEIIKKMDMGVLQAAFILCPLGLSFKESRKDTSVWIDFFKGKACSHVDVLELLITEGQDICICGIIMTEVLQGIREDKEYSKTKKHLNNLIFLPMPYEAFIKAAEIYRSLRQKGITIRKPIDCMIASVAMLHNIKLLHNDKDFDTIAKHCGLKAG